MDAIVGGNVDASEPYFVVDGTYRNRGRTSALQASCFALASGSTYFSKKYDPPSQPVLSDGAYAGIVIGGFLLIAGTAFLAYVIVKERQGQPLFLPLRDRDDDEDEYNHNYQSNNSTNNDYVSRDVTVSSAENRL